MTSKQESKLSMYNAVSTFCATNAVTVATVPAFQSAVTDFDNIVDAIRATSQAESVVIDGITQDKAFLRNKLIDTTVSISSAIFAYASSVNNFDLKQKVGFPKSDLAKLRDELLAGTCRNVFSAGASNLPALADYGITQPKLDALLTEVEDYEAAVPEPRNAVSNRSAQGVELVTLFRQADDVLKTRMDKLAVTFKAANAKFYNGYKINRIILDPGSSVTQLTGTVTPVGNDIPLVGVTVLVVQKNLTVSTNLTGGYTLPVPDPGDYTVRFTAEGYEEKTVSPVTITLGKTTTLNVELTLLPR